jgi:hypothetical protein
LDLKPYIATCRNLGLAWIMRHFCATSNPPRKNRILHGKIRFFNHSKGLPRFRRVGAEDQASTVYGAGSFL